MKNKEEQSQDNLDEEIVFEDESTPQDRQKKLQEKLNKCIEEKQEYLDGWQRAQADLINTKKRLEEEKNSFIAYANESFILELLPALDSFDMAFKDKKAWESAPEVWRKGVEYIHNQLTSVLENHGVSIIIPLGKPFDPKQHHSIESVSIEDEKQDGIIVEVIQKGYVLRDKVIRPAGVKVGTLSR